MKCHVSLYRYLVPASQNDRLEKLAAKISKNVNCDKHIRHKTTMIPPWILKKHDIQFARVFSHKIHIFYFLLIFCGFYFLDRSRSRAICTYTSWWLSLWYKHWF